MFTICQPWEIPTSFSLCLHQSRKTVRTTTSNLTGHAPRWLVRIFFLCVRVSLYRVNRNMQNREAAIPAAIFISRPASWPRFSPARPDSFPGFIMYLYLIRCMGFSCANCGDSETDRAIANKLQQCFVFAKCRGFQFKAMEKKKSHAGLIQGFRDHQEKNKPRQPSASPHFKHTNTRLSNWGLVYVFKTRLVGPVKPEFFSSLQCRRNICFFVLYEDGAGENAAR